MLTMDQYRRAAQRAAAFALVLAAALSQPALAQPSGISPEAKTLLRASTDYVAGLKQFSIDTRNTLEVVLVSGQKIQFDHGVKVAVERPNKLRAQRTGDLVDQDFYYDGKSLTLHNPSEKVFATVPVPGTLEEALDHARTKLDIVAPASDFIYKNAYDLLMQDVTDGFVVGKALIEGVRCDHLAFRSPHADWQIWIQEGAKPLPRKIVITTRDIVNAPQFAVVMTKWDVAPRLSDRLFSFKPPADAKKLDFLPLEGGAPKAK
jgi:hypothetical protein